MCVREEAGVRNKILVLFFLLLINSSISAQTPVANAGPDRTILAGEVIAIDGSATTGACDGMVTDTENHCVRWTLGYGGWTSQGKLIPTVVYPETGTFPATLTACNAAGTCTTDTANITVNAITEGTETFVTDSGNPVTNGTNLCNEINSRAAHNNPVITITAGVIYRRPPSSPCVLVNRTGSGYVTIRTSAWASLPSAINRVNPTTNALHFAIFETGVNANNANINSPEPIFSSPSPSVTPPHHYRFVGIEWRKTFPTLEYLARAFLDIGTGTETAINQLPHHIIVAHNYFNGGSTTSNTLRGIAARGTDISIINSYLYRFKGVGIETQAIFTNAGERIGITNCYIQSASEHVMFGGADNSITGHNPTDIAIRRNMFERDIGWCQTCGSSYGVNFSVKNLLEFKMVNRATVEANVFNEHWQEDQNWAWTITVRNQSGGSPWADISFVDFAYNKLIKYGGAVQILGKDSPNTSGTLDRLTIRHNVFPGCSFYNGQHNGLTITSGSGGAGADRLYVIRNSWDCNGTNGQGRWIEFDGNSGFTNCIFNGNIAQGFINFGPAIGEAAMQAACSTNSWEVKKNGFYASAGTNPANNTSVSLRSSVGFTNLSTFDLKLTGSSPFLTTGLGGANSGADLDTVNTLTSGAITGIWSSSQVKCNWHTSPACNNN